jgi:sugar/nucleoside kinase (ribokinase family)
MVFDVCVVGHITKETIRIDGRAEREMPGGTAYYASMALRRAGLKVAVLTKVSREDQERLLHDLQKARVTVFCKPSARTTLFENIYSREDLDARVQRVRSVAAPFSSNDLEGISATIFHMGPLTNLEISPDVLEAVSLRGDLVSLDIQGLLRRVTEGEVQEEDWLDKERGLAYVDILKADDREAAVLSGEDDMETAALRLSRLGPKEVIITLGSKGSLILAKGEFHHIPAFPPKAVIDPTGCGDTYMGGYISQRVRSKDVAKAGRFAASVAALKLEKFGPLR